MYYQDLRVENESDSPARLSEKGISPKQLVPSVNQQLFKACNFFLSDYISISSTSEENKLDQDKTETFGGVGGGRMFKEPRCQ